MGCAVVAAIQLSRAVMQESQLEQIGRACSLGSEHVKQSAVPPVTQTGVPQMFGHWTLVGSHPRIPVPLHEGEHPHDPRPPGVVTEQLPTPHAHPPAGQTLEATWQLPRQGLPSGVSGLQTQYPVSVSQEAPLVVLHVMALQKGGLQLPAEQMVSLHG